MKSALGVAAMFETDAPLLAALRRLRDEGYTKLEVYTPWLVEGALELLPRQRSRVPLVMLGTGICGAVGGLLLQVWAATDYPVVVAGRPLFSWPAFVPVTFEITVLTASLCGLASFLFFTRLPRLDHPIFNHPDFERASQDALFVCVRADDPQFEHTKLLSLLRECGALKIQEVPG